MRDYVIYTDSGCDISPAKLAEWGVPYKSLTFRFNGEEKEYENGEMDIKAFYDKMREGGVAKTAAVNVDQFCAIINPGEAGILAVSSAVPTPVVDKEGNIVVRDMMKVTLSVDHRIVDGSDGAKFVNAVKAKLEDPELWDKLI